MGRVGDCGGGVGWVGFREVFLLVVFMHAVVELRLTSAFVVYKVGLNLGSE